MAASTARLRFLGVEHAAFLKSTTPPTIVEHDIHFINTVGFDTQTTDISFEGDNQSVRKTFLTGITINITADTYDLAAITGAFAKNVVTAALPTGIEERVYFGDSVEAAGVRCGFLAQVLAENLTSNEIETVDFVAPMGTLTVARPPNLQYNTKGQLTMVFTAEKTGVDMGAVALPGLENGNIFWYLDRHEVA
jgi:hypothetical protein